MHKESNELGSTFVELALALPILLFMFLAAIELTTYLNDSQRVRMLAKEAARHAFVSCAKVGDELTADICLIQSQNEFNRQLNPLQSRTELIYSIYKYYPDTKTVERIGISGVDRHDKTPSGYQSSFVSGPLPLDEFSISLPNEEKPLIIIVEAYQSWRAAGFISTLVSIYELSIF